MTTETETKLAEVKTKTTEAETKPKFKIETFDDLKRTLTIARGDDPDAIQAVADFMDLKSPIERSYLPDKKTTICIAQLTGRGKVFYPKDEWEPFGLVAEALAVAFMPYKGFKSNQFVEMTSGQPNLDKLRGLPEETKSGILSGIFNRGKSE